MRSRTIPSAYRKDKVPILWIFFIFVAVLIVYFLVSSKFRKKGKKKKKATKKKGKYRFCGMRILLHTDSFIKDGKLLEKEFLILLLKQCDVFILSTVSSDEEEERIKDLLAFLVEEHGMKDYKILFNETVRGKIAVARQISCDLYVDKITFEEEEKVRRIVGKKKTKEFNFYNEISRFIPYVSLVERDERFGEGFEKMKRNMFVSQTLRSVFMENQYL